MEIDFIKFMDSLWWRRTELFDGRRQKYLVKLSLKKTYWPLNFASEGWVKPGNKLILMEVRISLAKFYHFSTKLVCTNSIWKFNEPWNWLFVVLDPQLNPNALFGALKDATSEATDP